MADTAAQELQESFLLAIRKSQEISVTALRAWVETVEYFTPKVSYAHLPLAGRLPKVEEAVASTFDFAEQVLASQRRFADDMLKVTSPLLPGDRNGAAASEAARRGESTPKAVRPGGGTSA
jgi:hypothetical protein